MLGVSSGKVLTVGCAGAAGMDLLLVLEVIVIVLLYARFGAVPMGTIRRYDCLV